MKTRDPQFTRRLGGVYAIICTVNGRQYIGNTTTTFHRRWVDHRSKLNTGAHPNKGLQTDWLLYGRDCFEFTLSILRACIRIRRAHILAMRNVGVDLYNVVIPG